MEDDTSLFRIMSLERFCELLSTKENVLIRPSKWEDPYESIVMKSAMMLNANSMEPFNEKHWYGQCWSSCEESDALWRIYSNGKAFRSIRIKTTAAIMKSFLNNDDDGHYFLEQIIYTEPSKGEKNIMKEIGNACQFKWCWGDANYDTIIFGDEFRNDNQLKAIPMLLTKRAPFNHEQEVRLLRYSKEAKEDSLFRYTINDLNIFIQGVTLDPWAPDGFEDAVKAIIDKYVPGNCIQVNKSDLYKDVDKGLLFDPYMYYEEYNKKRKELVHRHPQVITRQD
ncbi:MAG: hypothetical protein J5610_00825 [Prevotella sp.]|nr:hypothetical protein [Prevotella sp.]